MATPTQKMCPDCKGFGWNPEHTEVCPTCTGSGYVDKEYMESWQRSLLDQRREKLAGLVRAVIARGEMGKTNMVILARDVRVLV